MGAAAMIAALGLLGAGAGTAPPPTPGTVSVELVDDGADDGYDDRAFGSAVGQALGDENYTLLADHSRYVAEVSVARESRGIVTTRVSKEPASAGIGSWGPVVTVPLGSKKTALRDLVVTTLTVRLYRRADHRLVWSGSAVTAGIDTAPIAPKLARAVFATYPQTLNQPVSVP